ncbi:hypothetical protein AV656_13020 [Bhargavaea cecembensis]|uniref:Uncharacterized protein n=1 Tax=Bhargavaea cecembensis TaxID=394098 RepID=A0A161SQI0_9BACL|nr:hypothetical protein [Bhargavaea cecembensis]KZE37480.1 hypothetical protein AV656_13020 [Bhargavaea cecembensis]
MAILKYRSNCRFHYTNGTVIFTSASKKFSIRASEQVYLEIHRMLGELADGADQHEIMGRYPHFGKLVDLLEDQGLLYEIDEHLLTQHRDKAYFRIVETEASDVTKALGAISDAKITVSPDFFAGGELSGLLFENGLAIGIAGKNTENDVTILSAGDTRQVNVSASPEGGVAVAGAERRMIRHLGPGKVGSGTVSAELIAPFVFFSVILRVIGKAPEVFSVNEEFEVSRKTLYEPAAGLPEEFRQVSEDPIAALNKLEQFIGRYSSRILSVNGNPEYDDYRQLPLQIMTVQYVDSDDTVRSLYFADMDYGRLASFVSRTAFPEILERAYGSRTDSPRREGENIAAEIPESDTIRQLIKEKEMNLEWTIVGLLPGTYTVRIHDRDADIMADFRMPLEIGQIPVALYTYVSARENGIDAESAGFENMEYAQQFEEVNG